MSKTTMGETRSGRDNGKDDGGFRAIFTEQVASAARFLDTISIFSGTAGEATDIAAAYTTVHRSGAPDYWECWRTNAHKCG